MKRALSVYPVAPSKEDAMNGNTISSTLYYFASTIPFTTSIMKNPLNFAAFCVDENAI